MTDRSEKPDDRELMERFYACDSSAFTALWRQWTGRLERFAQNQGLPRELAEDVAQTVLIRLFLTKETRSFDVSRPLAPFLFTITRRLVVEVWRKRERESGSLEAMVDVEAEDSNPGAALEDEELFRDLLDCISRLSEQQRTYLFLCGRHGLGELTHQAIGEVMGRSSVQMTRISQNARENLRKCLETRGR